MSLFQVRAVAICLLINALDGFDILVIAFLAPEIAQQWKLSPDTLGLLLSAGLAGMTAGSLLLSPLADKYGRRPAILLSLAVTSLGMFASAFTADLAQLVVFSLTLGQIAYLSALAICIGLGVNAAVIALYAVVADAYPVDIRTTAIGWAIGIGRFSAVLAPVIAGFVLDFGAEESTLFLVFALPMLLAVGSVLAMQPRDRPKAA